MKFFLPFIVAIAVCSAGVIEDPISGYKEGDRFFYFPGDGDNILHLVDAEAPVDEEFIREYARNPANNAYWLYTRSNPTVAQFLVFGDANSVHTSNFQNSRDTVILAHGLNGHGGNTFNKILTKAFLDDNNVNIIVLDWNRLANKNYVTARNGVAEVGKGLGQFINWLTAFGLQYEKLHLVGFSLGGHLVGAAGRETGSRVARITSLDPAGPLYSWSSTRVVPTDGQYVEVIHTNTALLGYSDPCGDSDFYPNGGSTMPGCSILNLNSCSHSRAYEYMASSVAYNHLHANECGSLRDATRNRCTGSLNPMGNSDIGKSRTGIFRVNTGNKYPY